MRLTLVHKGLICVGVVLLSELALLAVLYVLHLDTQRELATVNRNRLLCSLANGLIVDMCQTSGILVHRDLITDKDQAYFDQINQRINTLQSYIGRDTKQWYTVEKTRKGIVALRALLTKAKEENLTELQEIQIGSEVDKVLVFRRRCIVSILSPEFLALADQLQQTSEDDPKRLTNRRDLVKLTLLVGLLFEITLFTGIFVLCRRFVNSRLSAISKNMSRAHQGLSLYPAMSGNDEFAVLDHSLHAMNDTLQESMRKERAIVENTIDVICAIDSDLCFSEIGASSETLLGYFPDEMTERPVVSFLPQEQHSRVEQVLKSLFGSENRSTDKIELQMLSRAQELIWCRWSLQYLPQKEHIYCVIYDITRQKEAEQIQTALVSMVSHDLRSPLGAIQNTFEIIEAGLVVEALPDYGYELVDSAKSSAQTMLLLVHDLLDLEKVRAGMASLNFAETNLTRIFETTRNSVSLLAMQGQIRLQMNPIDLAVRVDEKLLTRVLTNLVANAIKFSPRDSTVNVSVRKLKNSFEVRVKDRGPGIAPDALPYVFNRFFQINLQSSAKRGGSGLGLAICKTFVELHGGTIGVDSTPHEGSTFYFSVPKVCGQTGVSR